MSPGNQPAGGPSAGPATDLVHHVFHLQVEDEDGEPAGTVAVGVVIVASSGQGLDALETFRRDGLLEAVATELLREAERERAHGRRPGHPRWRKYGSN
ncbi:MAG TPA: hypothetical protein VFA26_18625 [Gemmataceae bacterium]|nr:hypothetical protein [Gemmataceae bacterium]